jgi:hypothetical protein
MFFKESQPNQGEKEELPKYSDEGESRGTTRRDFLKKAGLFGFLLATKPEKAIALAEKIANSEQGEKDPTISVEILYGAHARREDIEDLKEKLESADVYVPEYVGWDEKVFNAYTDVSQGKRSPDEAINDLGAASLFGPFLKTQLETLYNTGKPVVFCDVSDKDKEINAQLSESVRSDIRFLFSAPYETLEETISYTRETLIAGVEAEKAREALMLKKLYSLPEQFRTDTRFKDLKGKDDIKILLTLGAFHTSIYHDLDKSNMEMKRSMQLPTIFNFGTEARRRFMFGKEVGDKMLTNVFLESFSISLFDGKLQGITDNISKITRFHRIVVEKFSDSEIKNMFAQMQKQEKERKQVGDRSDRNFIFWLLFKEKAEQKGIRVPQRIDPHSF